MYKLIAFDLDGTLAESKQPITQEAIDLLITLSQKYQIAIITGGTGQQIRNQVISQLPNNIDIDLHLMPCSGSIYFYKFQRYSYNLTKIEKETIKILIKVTAESLGLIADNPTGEIIEDRGTQITFSALGQEASVEDKLKWDPTCSKRKSLRDALQKVLPDFEVKVGGLTSVDISVKGIDKAFALRQLMQYNNLKPEEILFVGDKFRPGENDYPALIAGVTCLRVLKYSDTPRIVGKYLG
jgi:HAD superfamily hydrolase (TIGR01484 family)